MSAFRADPIPRIRPAGYIPKGIEDHADKCIHADVHRERETTPERILKYRKSF